MNEASRDTSNPNGIPSSSGPDEGLSSAAHPNGRPPSVRAPDGRPGPMDRADGRPSIVGSPPCTPSTVAAPEGPERRATGIPSGIPALDARLGGLRPGGVYLIAGPPGPAKQVAALQFLRAGLQTGRRALLVTSADAKDILDASAAWGSDLRPAFERRSLDVIGFRDDFEMRVLRSAEPEDALEELSTLAPPNLERIAVDPGSLLIQGGARTLLGRSFVDWARAHPATVLVTLAIDGGELPSTAEWLLQVTNGVLLLGHGSDGLYNLDLRHARPDEGRGERLTLQLAAGRGLVPAEAGLTRRRSDRVTGQADRLLLLTLTASPAADLEGWARGLFSTEVFHDPLEAVSALQEGPGFGAVLIYTPRSRVPDTVRACRALRPLTSAPILVASDDAMRSADRVDMLEAGADDCISAGVDLRELAARIRYAAETGTRPPRKTERQAGPERPVGGRVAARVFEAEVRARLQDPWRSVLNVLCLTPAGGSGEGLQRILLQEIRSEQGDLLLRTERGFLVLLQGARRDAARAFLDRVHARAKGDPALGASFSAEVYSHPGDRRGILGLIPQGPPAAGVSRSVGPGGAGGQEV